MTVYLVKRQYFTLDGTLTDTVIAICSTYDLALAHLKTPNIGVIITSYEVDGGPDTETLVKNVDAITPKTWCECEHVSHFNTPVVGHNYGSVPSTVRVQTPYGKFAVCDACAQTCYRSFPVISSLKSIKRVK